MSKKCKKEIKEVKGKCVEKLIGAMGGYGLLEGYKKGIVSATLYGINKGELKSLKDAIKAQQKLLKKFDSTGKIPKSMRVSKSDMRSFLKEIS